MGMGAAPAHATVISKEHLTELCPRQMNEIEAKLTEANVSWGQLAQLLDDTSHLYEQCEDVGLTEDQFAELKDGWKAVTDRFAGATFTKGGCLEVFLCYYDREAGDRYDEIDGDFFFAVEGVQQYTPAGERFKDKLEDKMWTVFG